MMRFFRSTFLLCLVVCLLIGFLFLWNATYNCNPCGKDWYNLTARPSIAYPFREKYDGSYSITIDRDGKVLLTIDGDEVKGRQKARSAPQFPRRNSGSRAPPAPSSRTGVDGRF